MTPKQFKDIRIGVLGCTQSQMADALRLKTSRAIRQFESGERAVSGPVSLLMEIYAAQGIVTMEDVG